MNQNLIIGMPAGSLADSNRGGNLVKLLECAGFKTSGYDSGGPSKFNLYASLYGWDGRPQEFATQLGIDEIDVAIAGDDWMRERILELKYEYHTDLNLEKVLSLKRGGVRIVGIIPENHPASDTISFLCALAEKKEHITVVSEMPYLALDWMKTRIAQAALQDKFSQFSVQKYKSPPKHKAGVTIYETWGKTEAKVKNGGADIGMEITQSGSAIRSYGLKIIDTVLESETGIYINTSVRENTAKTELLRMFLINLYGAVNAENKVMIIFNVPNRFTGSIEKYLSDNNLFADEPTVSRGKEFTEYSIQVDISGRKAPLARIRYDLAMLKAKNINTIPIDSSIPGAEVISI